MYQLLQKLTSAHNIEIVCCSTIFALSTLYIKNFDHIASRRNRKIEKTVPGFENLIFGCYNEYSAAREDFVIDCNEFDYYPEPEDNFNAETLQRNNLNKDN